MLEYVVGAQLAVPLSHEVVTTVEVTEEVVVSRVLLCLGLKTGGALELGRPSGILDRVAEAGAMGPVKMAEVRRVLVGAGSKLAPPRICNSMFAQS